MPEYKRRAYIRIGAGVAALLLPWVLGAMYWTSTLGIVIFWILGIGGIALIVSGCRIYAKGRK